MLHATIKNFSYKKYLKEELKTCDFTDINTLPSKWLKRYSLLVSNAANGAVLKTEL